MKQLMAVLIVCTFLSASTAQAFYYEGKCLVPQGKFKKCFLDFSKQDSFKITHKDFEYYSLNREISGKEIQHIAMGEKAQRRWALMGGAIYALGPLGALFILWKKKMSMFSVEFGKKGKNTDSIMFGVKKKIGPEVYQKLEALSGQKIDFESGKM